MFFKLLTGLAKICATTLNMIIKLVQSSYGINTNVVNMYDINKNNGKPRMIINYVEKKGK